MAPTLQQTTTCSKEPIAHLKNKKLQQEDDEEDDDDLFEIDLEAVSNLPPPFYWESCLTVTKNTRFANCLVPKTDVSSAVPMANYPKDTKRVTWLGPGSKRVIWVRGAEPFKRFGGVSCDQGGLSNMLQKTLDVSSSFGHGK